MISKSFFICANEHFNRSAIKNYDSASWCSWTTFRRLEIDAGYWTAPLPKEVEISDKFINDGGSWGQPFFFHDIAHIIIPRKFKKEVYKNGAYIEQLFNQDIDGFAEKLQELDISCSISNYVLDIKLF